MKVTRSQKKKLDVELDKKNDDEQLSKKKAKNQNNSINNSNNDKEDKDIEKDTKVIVNGVSANEKEYLDYLNEIDNNLQEFKLVPKFFAKDFPLSNNILPKLAKLLKFTIISPLELYYKIKYDDFNKHAIDEEKCSICQCSFYEEDLKNKTLNEIKEIHAKKDDHNVILLNKCKDHFFHDECLLSMMGSKEFIKCPNCNKLYGIMTGDQPFGIFTAKVINYKCSGYKENTIQLYYEFPDGIINGTSYKGTTRNAYLPNTKEGKEILALFKITFDRKLMYIIGTSVTTGENNVVVWNGVHHKTNLDGGAQYFGYPDPTYFNRVKEEIAAKGIVQSEIEEDLISIADKFLADCDQKSKNSTTKKGKSKK